MRHDNLARHMKVTIKRNGLLTSRCPAVDGLLENHANTFRWKPTHVICPSCRKVFPWRSDHGVYTCWTRITDKVKYGDDETPVSKGLDEEALWSRYGRFKEGVIRSFYDDEKEYYKIPDPIFKKQGVWNIQKLPTMDRKESRYYRQTLLPYLRP